jgi:hypothetical protein
MEVMEFFIVILLLAVGPLAALFGTDSRGLDERDRRGWWPGAERR